MNDVDREARPLLPTIGCLSMALAVFILCLMPFFLVDVMLAALERLHLTPQLAVLTLIGIVLGSLLNIPVHRIEREEEQLVDLAAVFGLGRWMPYLLHLKDITKISAGIASIGGAGTFDGIVLSGVLAALLT